jgi:hypothetical protein
LCERKKEQATTARQVEPQTTPAIVSGTYPTAYDNFERRVHSLRRSTFAEDRDRERYREREMEMEK